MYKISYVADGVATEYQFTFPFFQNADVRVSVDNAVIAADAGIYSVVPNDDFTGGRVAYFARWVANARFTKLVFVFSSFAISANIFCRCVSAVFLLFL